MIIGNGLIAQLFTEQDREDVVFFASGVSNSLETEPTAFLREETLLRKTLQENSGKIFIYFSTCSIYDCSKKESPYVNHKLRMEQIVGELSEKFLILRASNAVGKGGNPNLLMNYLIRSVEHQSPISVHTLATRNLIDAEDVKSITLKLIDEEKYNRTVNVAYLENFSTLEILKILEKHLRKKPITVPVENGQSYAISIPEIQSYFEEKRLNNKEMYLKKIIEKYYS